jgi:epoxyqueuosine reductase
MAIEQEIRAAGLRLGFTRVGFARAERLPEGDRLREWLDRGYAGEMEWLHRRTAQRSDPAALIPWARSLILATLSYGGPAPAHRPGRGRIARYARGADYHGILKRRLRRLEGAIREMEPSARLAPVVDTGAVLEKPWAAAAGLGWQGKHTNLIDPRAGSWIFIGEILTDLDLSPDASGIPDRCGSCTRCLDACPTGAFPAPYLLDSRRCISYLTIEHRGSIPEELRPGIGDWVFGCDVCQEVCPWNGTPDPPDPELAVPRDVPSLARLLEMDEEEFRKRFSGSPIRRTGRRRLLRNVAVALGNSEDPRAVEPLTRALEDPDPLIREHVVWALEKLRRAVPA